MIKIQIYRAAGMVFIATALTMWLVPSLARAESVQWSFAGENYPSVCCKSVSGVHLVMTLSNPGVTVNYYAQAFLIDGSGSKIRQLLSSATLNAGDWVLFEFSPHVNSDISWYATGSAWGTPYGYWVAGATNPGSPACVIDTGSGSTGGKNERGRGVGRGGGTARYADESNKFASGIGIIDKHDGSRGGNGNLYARYAVNPPDESISTSGTWSSCVGAGDSNKICTIGSSGGTASATLTFATTQSNFYGDMTYQFTNANFLANSGGNYAGCLSMGPLGSALTVPAQTIQYSFNAAASVSGAPTAPVVSSAGTCIVGNQFTVTMTATDPNNHQLKYGVDWNDDGTTDQYVPATGYVNSGTSQSATRTYSTTGQKEIRVAAINDQGVQSAWTIHDFTCTDSGTCPVGYVRQGDQCIISSCPSGYVRQGDQCVLGGGCSTAPHCSGDALVNSCTGATISICDWGCAAGACKAIPAPSATLKATPTLLRVGYTTKVSWTGTNVSSCTVQGTNGDSWTGTYSSGETSKAIQTQTIYTLHCNAYAGVTPSSIDKSVVVNIIPSFQEQ